ncbi:hypothetical protein MMC18_000025 [Xylographa bjoerkii]|nr:hypothetical protein [Xylographa bjoerkii]
MNYFWLLPVLASVFYVVIVVIYRLTIHPLAKYPGPIVGRVTDWYSVYHAWKGDRHLDFHRLHQRYGTIVRFGPNRISVNSSSGMRAIYGPKCNVQKSNFYTVFNHFFQDPSTTSIINKDQHSRKRRILAKGLSERSLKAVEQPLISATQNLFQHVSAGKVSGQVSAEAGKGWSTPQDMAQWFNYIAFDLMGEFCFGESFDMVDKEDNRHIIDIISDGVQCLNIVGHMPRLLELRLENLLFSRLVHGLHEYQRYSERQARKCMKKDPEKDAQSVFDLLLPDPNTNSEEAFTITELTSESSLLILAGSDTTSTALAHTLFHLLNNPQTLKQLTAEIRSTFRELNEIQNNKALRDCQYLRACIDESLRLTPPVAGLMSREVLPGGLDIDGHHFPAGVDIGTCHYALQHSETYYRNAFGYDPLRWIISDRNTAEDVALAQSAFCAFSIGPRGCAGKAMAYMEMTIILARMVWLFDVRLAKGDPLGQTSMSAAAAQQQRDYQTMDKFVSKVFGPVVEFRGRDQEKATPRSA